MDANEKIKYQKSRYMVKKWESEFKSSKGFAPSKNDIRTAPRRVKDAYSTYWKLKAVLLESSLIDATLDENAKDCFSLPASQVGNSPLLQSSTNLSKVNRSKDSSVLQVSQDSSLALPSLESSQVQTSYSVPLLPPPRSDVSVLRSSEPVVSQPSNDSSLVQPLSSSSVSQSCEITEEKSKQPPHQSLETLTENNIAQEDKRISDSVWGSHLSFKPTKNIRSLKERSVSFQYSEKLFAGAKFSKRNPRKPGSFKRNKTFDALPDASSGDISCNGVACTSKVDLDISPIDMSEGLGSGAHEGSVADDLFKEKGLCEEINDETGAGHFNLLSEVQRVVIKEAPKIQYQGVSAVGALLSEKKLSSVVNRKVDSGWLGRLDSDSGIASGSCPAEVESSSDELIWDSDEESKSKSRFNLTSTSSQVSRPETNIPSAASSRTNELKMNLASIHSSVSEKISQPVALSFASKIGTDNPKMSKRPALDFTPFDPNASTESSLPQAKRVKLEISTPAAQADKARAAKKRQVLEKKVLSGAANNNFVRVDLKKKIYTKGEKGMNFSKFKKRQWKELKGLDSSGVIKCFKCGDVGHMAKQCKGVGDLLPYDECEEESIFPSLEEAAKAAASQQPVYTKTLPQPEEDTVAAVEPLFKLNEDRTLPDTPEEVLTCLKELGHDTFLQGQEEAVMSILCGESCLVVMPTGSGKSLCYRLPALMYHRHREGALTLVVSPLVSLMEDQVLSSGSNDVGCLHHCQTEKQRKAVEQRLAERELSVLLVSPEMLSSDSSLSLASRLPSIALACIDEAHCLSHWSHNFRPSYLTLCQVLREKLKVKRLLGLTASVTAGTVNGVLNALGGEGVRLVRSTRFLPENLVLSVSTDMDRDEALVCLLQGSRFASCSSIIVYCTRREECARISALLRTRLQNENGKKTGGRKSRLSMDAEVYHAGLTPSRRKQVQNAFMSGKVRIVVATVAFGMGLNKRDLRGVIHYNMPSSLENYLQEIGRAGRDGLTAHCHLFLSPASNDLSELKRHIYSSSVDRGTLRRLLELINGNKCKGCTKGVHEVAIPIDSSVEELDVAQEVISTLLAYLSATGLGYSLLPSAYTLARVGSYKGSANLASLAVKCGVLGVGLAQARENGCKVSNSAEFNVIHLADTVSWTSGQVKRALKQLEWIKSDTDGWSKSGLNVEFINLGFRLMVPCDLSPDQQDAALDLMHQRALTHERTAVKQLNYLHNSLKAVAYVKVEDCSDDIDMRRCEKLAGYVHEYFTSPTILEDIAIKESEVECESEVSSSIRSLVGCGDVSEWTGRAIARILHGISSPRYPALVWARTPYWRRHLDQDFTALISLASRLLRTIR